jgi:hypothetical protein
MRRIAFAAAAVIGISVELAHGACTTPPAPACAIAGAFASASDQDACRQQMIAYKSDMEERAKCLRDEGGDGQAASAELEHVLAEFNRRSRELPAQEEPEEKPSEEKAPDEKEPKK